MDSVCDMLSDMLMSGGRVIASNSKNGTAVMSPGQKKRNGKKKRKGENEKSYSKTIKFLSKADSRLTQNIPYYMLYWMDHRKHNRAGTPIDCS